jgi:hypothetical protein
LIAAVPVASFAKSKVNVSQLFATVVLVSIPLFLLWSYWNATVEIFVKVPRIIEEHVRKFIYGE